VLHCPFSLEALQQITRKAGRALRARALARSAAAMTGSFAAAQSGRSRSGRARSNSRPMRAASSGLPAAAMASTAAAACASATPARRAATAHHAHSRQILTSPTRLLRCATTQSMHPRNLCRRSGLCIGRACTTQAYSVPFAPRTVKTRRRRQHVGMRMRWSWHCTGVCCCLLPCGDCAQSPGCC